MKLEIVTEKDNPLMKRKRYWLSVEHPGKETPSRYQIVPEVVKKLGTKEDLVVIDKIFSERGNPKSAIKVFVYRDKKDILPGMLERQQRKVNAYVEKKEKGKEEKSAAQPSENAQEAGGLEGRPEGEREAEEEPVKEEAAEEAEEVAGPEEEQAEEGEGAGKEKADEGGEEEEPPKEGSTKKEE